MTPAAIAKPVCARCANPLGDQSVTVHRRGRRDFVGESVSIHYDCATPEERRAQAERKAKGTGW